MANKKRIALEREDKVVHPQVLRVGQESLVVAGVLWENCYGTWFTTQWAGYSQVSHSPLLASGLGSCRQLPFKLALFLETDFQTIKHAPLSLRVVYNFKCFLQLASLAGNDLPNKMFLISTPYLGILGSGFLVSSPGYRGNWRPCLGAILA